MSSYPCFNFTGLIRLFQSLPTVTNLDVDNPPDVFSADFDNFVRAGFWGTVIVVATVAVLYASCFYYCCVCCCYCCGGRADDEKPKALRAGCSCVTIFIVLLTLGLAGVIIWIEIRFNNGIVENYIGIESVINATNIDNFSAPWPVLDLRMYEHFRHYSGLSWIALVIVIIVGSILSFLCACIRKSQAVVNVCIGVYAITSFLSSVYSGALFTYLISLSDQCQDIRVQLLNSCTNASAIVVQVDSLCNQTSQLGFLLLMLGCGLILFFILTQIIAAQYAGSLTKSKYKYVEYSSEIVISAPISASGPGVWGAYGTQALMGTTSQGQSVPQSYARNPLVPITEQYMMHANNNTVTEAHHPNYLRVHSQTSQDQGNYSDATNSFDLTTSYDHDFVGTGF